MMILISLIKEGAGRTDFLKISEVGDAAEPKHEIETYLRQGEDWINSSRDSSVRGAPEVACQDVEMCIKALCSAWVRLKRLEEDSY